MMLWTLQLRLGSQNNQSTNLPTLAICHHLRSCTPIVQSADYSATPIDATYPSPTQNQVQFTWNPTLSATRISIYSVAGQLVEEVDLAVGQGVLSLELGDWQRGIYFTVLESEEGAILGREKLIINH